MSVLLTSDDYVPVFAGNCPRWHMSIMRTQRLRHIPVFTPLAVPLDASSQQKSRSASLFRRSSLGPLTGGDGDGNQDGKRRESIFASIAHSIGLGGSVSRELDSPVNVPDNSKVCHCCHECSLSRQENVVINACICCCRLTRQQLIGRLTAHPCGRRCSVVVRAKSHPVLVLHSQSLIHLLACEHRLCVIKIVMNMVDVIHSLLVRMSMMTMPVASPNHPR